MTNTIDVLLAGIPPAAHAQFLRQWVTSAWLTHRNLMQDLSDRNHPFFKDSLHELLTIKVTCQDLINDGLIEQSGDPITTSKAKYLANIDVAHLTTLARWQSKSKKLP